MRGQVLFLIFAGMLVYGFFTQFATLDAIFFVIDYLATVIGTRRYGGAKATAWGAVIGALAGVVLFGPFGIILGPFPERGGGQDEPES